ncbi:MAG TPA: hypothetical protein PKE26_06665 [Kiritimatiellia bacterium]|nr:hypothetical protein [Kiritimatiellia bacterium]HMO98772.1 hypothetical protein [Kiritimatiellia bacterium]HMP97973.1 hypothetical protein [Kiritimatiellia bacterium]
MAKEKLTPNLLTKEDFKKKLDQLIGDKPIKIWLAKSVNGRLDTLFSAGDAQGKPIKHFDHIGGFYLLGENVPPDMIPAIHKWFVIFAHCNFTRNRMERHFIDTKFQQFYDGGKRYREELVMHVPLSVHGPANSE